MVMFICSYVEGNECRPIQPLITYFNTYSECAIHGYEYSTNILKKSEQLPTDQEQFMLIEGLYKATEKLEITQEQNMTNKVNIQFLNKQLEKAILDIERLKDKVRANGNGDH